MRFENLRQVQTNAKLIFSHTVCSALIFSKKT